MSFVIQGEITIDADGAVRGVKISRDQLKGLGADAAKVETQLKGAVTQTAGVGRASGLAAGQVGNLAAQFNDIGVMLAAGQNPLQLAIQQGSQITQVLGPLGARGSVKALGAAFTSMINPVSLATYAIIAGGAALVSWAFSAGKAEGKGASFEDRLGSLTESVSEYMDMVRSSNDAARPLFDDLKENIEGTSQAYRDLIALARIDAFNNVQNLNETLARSVTNYSRLVGEVGDAGDLLGIETQLQGSITIWRDNREEVADFIGTLENLKNADGLDAQYAAAVALREEFKSIVDTNGEMTERQREFWRNLSNSIYQMELLGAATEAAEKASNGLAPAIVRGYQAYQDSRVASDAALASAQEMLVTRQRETAIQAAIAKHGEDSAEVAALRAAAERDAYEEVLATLPIAEALKDELRAAFEAGQGIATTDMAGPISAAATEAGRLAENLAIARGQRTDAAIAAMGGDSGFFDPRGNLYGSSGSGVLNPDRPVPVQNRPGYVAPRLGTSGGSGGGRSAAASEADREREAVTNLLDTLRQERDIREEADPVLKEMIGYRDQLKAATAGERAEVEKLIRARIEEEAALERQQELWGLWSEASMTAITDVNGALNMLLASLQKAALTGGGPLGFLFGGQNEQGVGGLLGTLFTGLFPGKAQGGIILGAGGPRDDRQLTRTSPGEYIVNARATARNRALLDAINYGTPGMANGGIVGGARAAAVTGGGARSLLPEVHVHVTGGSSEDVYEQAKAGTEAALREYDQHVLPLRLREISNNPEVIG